MEFPTGGIFALAEEPASACLGRVSRSGEMPEPTVTVRMGENKAFRKSGLRPGFVRLFPGLAPEIPFVP